jgi:uncharacterized protein
MSIKKIFLIILAIILVAIGANILLPHISGIKSNTSEKKVIIHQNLNDGSYLYIENKGIRFKTRVAESESTRAAGLSGVIALPDDEAVLFVFEKPGFYSFWMKDMLFPLDILWLDQNFKVVEIKRNISPASYPETFNSPLPAKYVLEINAGLSERFNFQIGDIWTVLDEGDLRS